ncbi:hypothetical protein P8A19_02745 [Streptomyces poriferorum]|uniref:N-acetyltransferase domain-containing protein n=1 Tax=Streptomyces poriferorum TaxID=2798799 RepID=A0ABY9IGU2_9ACTN|nr:MULTISPECIES: hypothetical protein [unclassified Streptomyces]MDP5316087.1 hypothetical protein [Streptomyces sp. Alt4]WLQ54427.1 hypothetical protein P8A19_02745 [Streptomyces sp. Alt2]
MRSSTRIRLIEPADATPIAAHRVRDFEAFRLWEPAQPADFFTPEGQAERIDSLLAGYRTGTVRPGVVLADNQVIGQVTVGGILPHPRARRARRPSCAPDDDGRTRTAPCRGIHPTGGSSG